MSKVRYYQTDDMEAAVRSLSERHRNVLVLMDYKSVRPIRMRTKAKLADLDIDWCMAWKPESAAAIERWRKRGGIMQYRSDPNKKRPECPVSDSILFVECPMQWDRFEYQCMSARQEVVVYRPPTWSLHAQTIEYLFPQRETYEALEAYLDALVFTEQTRSSVRTLLQHSAFERSVAFTPYDVLTLFGWDEKYLRYVLNRHYRRAVHRWHPYRLRLKPDHPDLRWAWDVLRAQPEIEPRVHALKFDTVRPRLGGFVSMMKLLAKGNYVRREDCIYVANVDRPAKDPDAMDAVNNMHRGRWFQMRNFVDELPEYPI